MAIADALALGLGLLILAVFLFRVYRRRQRQAVARRWEFVPADEPLEALPDAVMQQIREPKNQMAAAQLYQPIGLWTGRLILPAKEQRQLDGSVLFEVYNASDAHQDLIGKVVWLQWSSDPQVQAFVESVTRDVQFTKATIEQQKTGSIHPIRLNHWKRVGPLESLAGARLEDDVIVMLRDPVVVGTERTGKPALVITQEPVQISGRIVALVTILRPLSTGSDKFVVRHFNKISRQFDGPLEIIRIPQAPPDRHEVPRSTNYLIEKSPLNAAGWYIYGEKDAGGLFVAEAIEPRSLMRLQPDEVYFGLPAAKHYVRQENWKNTTAKKGTGKKVFLLPASHENSEVTAYWQEGDQSIVIHAFGGIAGKKAEPTMFGIVTGHFSYGIASVVRDPFTDDLRFDIEYRQVYAHNVDGIISGTIKWFSYMGDLRRGWLGNRPVSDVIVKFDAITQDYNFAGIKLSPMSEFCRQMEIMTARYRIGDGTGAAIVTPSKSCVQDSNQALYITIERIEAAVEGNRQIQDWLRRHPNDSQAVRFSKLVDMARSLEKNLIPFGTVRSDWYKNLLGAAGANREDDLMTVIIKAITTWRTMLPRRAHDEMATILLRHGAGLWIIRTNQVGGFDRDIEPLAPTAILGHRSR
ncbi:MAG: abortive infection protein [Microcoleus vaginatus WJT46-NPBG5]|jgi:predicted Abi (CAAX) family protease|nr:abortive infection protein [Microcoleus vaginatus WJT46-NPBG5]